MVLARFACAAVTLSLALLSSAPSTSLAAVVESRPYAPGLYSRSSLESDDSSSNLHKRSSGVLDSRPYAPNLFSRAVLDNDDEEAATVKRSQLLFTAKEGFCSSNSDCFAAEQYCDESTSRCAEKLEIKAACSRDVSCMSGFCSAGKCTEKVENGKKCGGIHSACYSGFCSPRSKLCKPKADVDGSCIVTAGCKDNLSCISGKCFDHSKVVVESPTPVKRSALNPSTRRNSMRMIEELASPIERGIMPDPSGSHLRPREFESTPVERNFFPSPSGSRFFPRELGEANPVERNFFPSPSGSHHFPRDLEMTETPTAVKRAPNAAPSGLRGNPVFLEMAKWGKEALGEEDDDSYEQ